MKRRISGIVTALLLASLGTALLVAYVQSAKNQAVASEEKVGVFVVGKLIPKGAAATAENVQVVQVPVKARAEGVVTNPAELKGLVAAVDLLPGEQLLRGRFVTPQVVDRGIAPPDKVQVSVALDPTRTVGGRVRAGDLVGVVVSFKGGVAADGQQAGGPVTKIMLHKVLVVGVQMQQAPPPATPPGNDTRAVTQTPPSGLLVTFALNTADAEKVVFAAENGSLWLVAEAAEVPEGSRAVTYGSVF